MLNNNKKQETQFFGTKCGNANSIAAGYATETTNYGEIATGILNKSTKGDNPNSPEGVVGDPKATLFSVGCGTKGERKNALEVKGDGSVIISGKDGSNANINKEIKYLKDRSVVLGDDDQVLIPYLSADIVMLIRKVNVGDYIYAEIEDGLEDDTVPQYIYDVTTDETIKITENKFNAIEINRGDYFNTEESLNLSHELYLDNEKTGNISDLEKLTIKESDVFEDLPYVCEDDTLEDDEAPQYIYDATDKKWITVNESYYISSADFFNTEKPLDLSHILRYNKDKNIFDYNRTAGSGAVVMGYKAQASNSSIALGSIAEAKGNNSIALGTTASTRNTDCIAIGTFARTKGEYCIALGSNTNAEGDDSIALGVAAYTKEEKSIAIGTEAVTKSDKSTVLGCEAKVPEYASGSTIVGYKAQTGGGDSVALGHNAQSAKGGSVVIGAYAQAANYNATVVGCDAHTTSICATAVGCKAQTTGELSIALGYNAQATHDYAIALGSVTKTKPYSKYALGGYDKNKKVEYNIEEITFSQYGNKKYIIGLGGYDGTNLTTNNEAGKEVLNPDIKSVQEIINGKADITPIIASTDAAITLQPNKKYEITAGDTLVLTFTEPSDKTHKNEYLFSINTGSSVSTITFPIEIIWDVEPVIAANKHYEINVQYSQGRYWGTVHTWNIPS